MNLLKKIHRHFIKCQKLGKLYYWFRSSLLVHVLYLPIYRLLFFPSNDLSLSPVLWISFEFLQIVKTNIICLLLFSSFFFLIVTNYVKFLLKWNICAIITAQNNCKSIALPYAWFPSCARDIYYMKTVHITCI